MTTASSQNSTTERPAGGLRKAATGILFALVLLIPRALHLRRDERSWTLFRVLLALAGAALVVLPLSIGNSWIAAIAGLVIFLIAILLPGAKTDDKITAAARELNALVVVNGGSYQPGNASAEAVQLFAGAERIWALDKHLRPVLVIPVMGITSANAQKQDDRWLLRVQWNGSSAEFRYRGVFAEHFARVAESTLRSLMHPSLPVLPRSRAARA
jgi:hypothetical protein